MFNTKATDFRINLDILKNALIVFIPIYLILQSIFAYIYHIQTESDLMLKKAHEAHARSNGKNSISSELLPVIEDIEFLAGLIAKSDSVQPINDETKLQDQLKELASELDLFAQTHKRYDQVRFIGQTGWEKIRINNFDTGTETVSPEGLQYKGERYYFKNAMAVEKGSVYFSQFDLNIENGNIEIPYKPMIRIAKPIYGKNDNIMGVVVLNYLGQYLINKIKMPNHQIMLLNKDGFWLKGMKKENEWGFMFKKKYLTFQNRFPSAWNEISRSSTGQIETPDGLFTFTTVFPLDYTPGVIPALNKDLPHPIDPSEYYWKLVLFMPHHALYAQRQLWKYGMISLSIIMFFILGWVSLRFSWLSAVKQEKERMLVKSKQQLEDRVLERTQSLEKTNIRLRDEFETRKMIQSDLEASEKKYRTLIETMPEGLVVLNAEGLITYANNQFLQIVERRNQNIIGKKYSEFFDRTNLKIFEAQRKKRMSGIAKPFEIDWTTGCDRRVPTLVSPAVIRDETGAFNGSFGIISDITQRKKDEQAIQLSQKRLMALFELNKMEDKTEHELASFALEKGVELTESQGGYFHFYDEDSRQILLTSWSKDVLKVCESAKGSHYPLENAGIWADCIRFRKPVLHNDYQGLSEKKGYPEGHFHVSRHMSIPVYDGNHIIAIAGVGNKAAPYNDLDVEQLNLLITETWRIISKKKAKQDLYESEAKHRSMMEAMDDPAYICLPDYTITYQNPAMIRWLGKDSVGERCYSEIYNEESVCTWCPFDKIKNLEHSKYTVVNPRDDHHYNVSNSPIKNADGTVSKFTIFRDVTETLDLAKQLRQVQKLEAIGTLAGGIAHDFNNILFAIMGYAQIALSSVNPGEQVHDDIQEILKAGHRAKDLVQQILTFSRQTEQAMQPLKIQYIVKEALKLLKASLPSTIEINADISTESKIMGDATQIHQVIMNLCTNSAHAMEESGGLLTIKLQDIVVDGKLASKFINMPTGKYLYLNVTDTGHGIDNDSLERIFEPFYTTKPEGEGTGLGLSLVHSIVKNHKGQISVESKLGQGTSFNLYLPILDPEEHSISLKRKIKNISGGNEKILVVDDEESIIKVTKRTLVEYGYTVDGVTDPEQAITLFKQSPWDYDMVVTDMTMPVMTGDILAQKLLQIRSDLPIVLITGFSNKLDLKGRSPKGIKKILLKPVLKSDLLCSVRNALDDNENST